MASPALVERLEAVASRLERVAHKMGAPGGDDDGDGVPIYVTEYEAIITGQLRPVIDAVGGLEASAGEYYNEFFMAAAQVALDAIRAQQTCRKPPGPVFAGIVTGKCGELTEKVKKLTFGRKNRKKNAKIEYLLNFLETIVEQLFTWVFAEPPILPLTHYEGVVDYVRNMINGHVIKNGGRSAQPPEWNTFYQAINAFFDAQRDYIKENFKTGLDRWNPQGGDFAEYEGGDAPPPAPAADSGGATEAKEATEEKAPAAAGGDGGGGMAGVFGELSQGLAVTSGLKKVTAGMKTKNRDPNERSGVVRATKKKKRAAAKKKTVTRGAPGTVFRGGRWMSENYSEAVEPVVIAEAGVQQNVYIATSENTAFDVPVKVKAVTIDSCVKCRVFLTEVVSTVEMVNCKSVTLVVRVKAPSIAVDKCQSPTIILTPEAFAETPDIITSNVSAMNVEFPGVGDDADPVQLPVPEQFLSRIDPETRTMTTTEVTHG